MDMNVSPDIKQAQRIIHFYPGCSTELLCRCKYFEVNRIQVSKEVSFSVMNESFQVITCLEGNGKIQIKGHKEYLSFSKGDTVFIPADSGRIIIEGKLSFLKIRT